MKKVLVTGAKGQLGKSIAEIAQKANSSEIEFFFADKSTLDITDTLSIEELFQKNKFDYCVNCAAYTAVDLAEDEPEKAFLINAEAVKNLSAVCQKHNVIFIHISTDYVFDGEKTIPYLPSDETNPINVYGQSKRRGEIYALQYNPKSIVIRTSWVYSNYGKNFYTTMCNLMTTKEELNIVADQIGKPTHAGDLAQYILEIIVENDLQFGIRHFAGSEIMSWYDFAVKIAQENGFNIQLNPITTDQFPTKAKRPKWSVLA